MFSGSQASDASAEALVFALKRIEAIERVGRTRGSANEDDLWRHQGRP